MAIVQKAFTNIPVIYNLFIIFAFFIHKFPIEWHCSKQTPSANRSALGESEKEMGYESKIYVVRKGSLYDGEAKRFAQKIAEFNLCKVYGISTTLRRMPKTNCYIYMDDGNTEILEDKYGDELTECTPEKLIELIEKDIKTNGDYWRYNLILATLRELVKFNDNQIVCLHYGY